MDFSELKLIPPILQALKKEGYTSPTPIQEQCISPLLEGKDLMGIAQTGTGKTAAFLLPILQRLTEKKVFSPPGAPRVLILAPTRELAAQIDKSCKDYGKYLHITHTVIFGGVGQNPQVKAMKRGVDILVATPGRLLDLINQRHIKLNSVEVLVLDEADRMLDMGFIHDVKKVISLTPNKRQTLCFSATMSKDVEKLARSMLENPVHVEVTPQATTVEKIQQKIFFVDQKDKDTVLIDLLKQEDLGKTLVFTRTKHRANKVAKKLCAVGINADAIHGNKSQQKRTLALAGFQKGRIKVLVATDIAARGIDVEGISHVINYDLPNEAESYVHRIGRTARAGKEGTAYSFCAAEERGYLTDIEKLTKQKIEIRDHKRHSKAAQNSSGNLSRSAHQQRGKYGSRPSFKKGPKKPFKRDGARRKVPATGRKFKPRSDSKPRFGSKKPAFKSGSDSKPKFSRKPKKSFVSKPSSRPPKRR